MTGYRLTLILFSLWSFGAILASSLGPSFHTRGIQGAADQVIPDTGKVLHPSAADQYNGVLLKVVTFPGNVGGNFQAVG